MKSLKAMRLIFCIILICILVYPVDSAFSSGSVRGANRSPQGSSWSGARTSGSVQRSSTANSASRSGNIQSKSGQSLSGSKNVSKSGDTVNVDKTRQSSSGASKNTSKQYDFDDGQLGSVERQTSGTNRYGQSANWEGKAERKGYGVKFEGEGSNRYGQKTEVEGYGARGYYGTGVVADVEGGRYGNRTVVAGKPYGGAAWSASLPYGARPYTYHGYPYYYHGGAYYRSYYYRSVPYYCYVPPPYGVYYDSPPIGAIILVTAAVTLMYAEGTYYKSSSSKGTTQYVVVAPPAGTSLPGTALPADRATITISGTTYYFYGNTFYKRVVADGKESFVVVTRPAGVITVKALPPEFEPVQMGNLMYFKTKDRVYISYLDPSGEELFLVVDPPVVPQTTTASSSPAPKPAAATTQAPQPAPATPQAQKPAETTRQAPEPAPAASTPQMVNLTVSTGTALQVRIANNVYSASTGQNFKANLAQDIIVDGRLVAPAASAVIGTISVSQETLTLKLTDLDVGGRLYPIQTGPVQAPKSTQSTRSIDSVVDPAKSSNTKIVLAAGRPFEFRLAQPFTVSVLVSTPATQTVQQQP